jgi:hypothetical protein
VLDLRGGTAANGTAVQQYPSNGSNAQKFRFLATDSGYYRIVSALSDSQALDVNGAGTANGTKVQSWTWGGGSNQQWMAVDAGSGYINLRPRHVGRCLDVPGGSTSASTQLQIYDCNGTSSQQFLRTVVGGVDMSAFVGKYNGAKGVTSVIASAPLPGQCTSFVTRYLQEVRGYTVSHFGNAVTWAGGQGDSASLGSQGFTWHGGATDLQNGDVLVWGQYAGSTSAAGHIGVWYNGQVFDQNDSRNARPYDSATGTYAVGFANFWSGGYLGYWRK